MIQINNLVKKFDDFTALDGVNMNVEKGAVYGLVGPNGAGKSTLIRHITGVMRQDAGAAAQNNRKTSQNQFHNFKQRDTDYDALMLQNVKEWMDSPE